MVSVWGVRKSSSYEGGRVRYVDGTTSVDEFWWRFIRIGVRWIRVCRGVWWWSVILSSWELKDKPEKRTFCFSMGSNKSRTYLSSKYSMLLSIGMKDNRTNCHCDKSRNGHTYNTMNQNKESFSSQYSLRSNLHNHQCRIHTYVYLLNSSIKCNKNPLTGQ